EVGLFTQGINVNSVATASFSNVSGIPTTIIPSLVGAGGVQLDIAPLEFSLFPNPAQSEINVKMGEDFIGKEVTVQIMNQLGQTVMVRRLNEVQNPVENIRLDNFAEGVYFLTLRTEGQEAITKKFIVKGLRP
nr:T9SS type A sorting domain-containing protein [Saprospiraceae bacterium]